MKVKADSPNRSLANRRSEGPSMHRLFGSSGAARAAKGRRLRLLNWGCTLFSVVRVAACVPTLWGIEASGDSRSYSVWTWLVLFGLNASMAAWLALHGDRRLSAACAVNIASAAMCLVTTVLIVAYR